MNTQDMFAAAYAQLRACTLVMTGYKGHSATCASLVPTAGAHNLHAASPAPGILHAFLTRPSLS